MCTLISQNEDERRDYDMWNEFKKTEETNGVLFIKSSEIYSVVDIDD